MQVQQLPLYQFLEGSGKSFIIPVYQRDYAWTRINCQKLWDDLVSLHENSKTDHFLGTLVTVGSGFQEYSIIDGQQRLTTASLLLIALHNHLKKKTEKSDADKILEEQILDFLVNKYSPEKSKRIRLKPNKQDKSHFDKLFDPEEELDASSNIISNYHFFSERISSNKLKPEEIFEVFRKLKVVLIDLVRGQDNPQLIFESLNSTGVDLTAGDLIRNFILMDLEPVEQERLYTKYWTAIEQMTGDVAEFVRTYLTYKTKTSVKKDAVYSVFKMVARDIFHLHKEEILQELQLFAGIYSWLVQISDHPNNVLNASLQRIKRLEFTVCYPYLFDVFKDVKDANITEETVLNILRVLESYGFRKVLVDSSTQGLNKLFVSLAREIKKEDHWRSQYMNVISYILLEKRATQRFPNNEEFESALVNKEIYRLQSKNRNFLLQALENYNRLYPIDLDNSDNITVEHIMPQTLTADWRERLGEHWQEIHNKYVHTLGNLTLTAKNSQLSNNSFDDKQKIDFQESRLKLNFKLDGKQTWSESEIIERAKNLAREALEIWPYPITSYSRPLPEEQYFDLTSEDSFSGTKPKHLFLADKGVTIDIKTWRDLLLHTIRELHEYSPTQFVELQKSAEFKWYFDTDKQWHNPLEFMPGDVMESGISANGIVKFLSVFCDRLGYPLESIQFSLRE